MGMKTIKVKTGQRPTKKQIREIQAAAEAPITYTPDCPESTPAALAEFAAMARELRQNVKSTKPAVTIRISQACLSKYKALGKGYTGIMADVLDYVADNPELLIKARG